MTFSVLTTEDPLYLPAFFERVLAARAADTRAVYVVPPLYRRQGAGAAALRYARTFGIGAAAQLAWRLLGARRRHQSIHAACRRHGVACHAVADVNAPGFLERLRRENADLLVSVSCPQVFRAPLIALPRLGILNIHGAALPRYRGVLPSFWMLANGETEAGVTIYFVNEQIDAGDRCGLRLFPIPPEATLDEFLHRSKAVAAELLLEVLGQVEAGTVTREPLRLDEGSYFSWPDAAAVRRFRDRGRRLW